MTDQNDVHSSPHMLVSYDSTGAPERGFLVFGGYAEAARLANQLNEGAIIPAWLLNPTKVERGSRPRWVIAPPIEGEWRPDDQALEVSPAVTYDVWPDAASRELAPKAREHITNLWLRHSTPPKIPAFEVADRPDLPLDGGASNYNPDDDVAF